MERLQGVEGRGGSRVHHIATSAKGTRLRTSGRSAVKSRLRVRARRRRWMICIPFASSCEQVPNQQRARHAQKAGSRPRQPGYTRGEANDNVEMTDRDKQTRDSGRAAGVGSPGVAFGSETMSLVFRPDVRQSRSSGHAIGRANSVGTSRSPSPCRRAIVRPSP